MPLPQSRITLLGSTPHAHEREGLQCVFDALPDRDPYHAWALVDLLDPASGRLHEIDLIVLGQSALYLLELKAYAGTIEGDAYDWTWTTPEGRRIRIDNPLHSIALKAKVLASRLDRLLPRRPRVEELVLLHGPDLNLKLHPEGRTRVITRAEVTRALIQHEFPGAAPLHREPLRGAARHDLLRALQTLGLRPRHGRLTAGPYELGDLLADGPGYQDRIAVHKEHPSIRRRARTYLVPEQTTVERRQVLKRAADREARLLEGLRDHRGILACLDYIPDAAPGPTVLFDAFEGGKRLDAYLAEHPDLSSADRVDLILQVGRALAHCHDKRLHHGALSPEAVLVRDRPDGGREARLFNFQLGAGQDIEGTVHRSTLAAEPFAVYVAPELRRGALPPTDASDLFSLGALAYFLLTGKPPATTAAELDARLDRDRHLDPRAARNDILPAFADWVCDTTALALRDRQDPVADWLDTLELQARATDAPPAEIDPLFAREGQVLGAGPGALTVQRRLGRGATALVLAVLREGGRLAALKISDDPDHDRRLQAEADLLARLAHPRVVELHDRLTLAGRPCLLLAHAGDRSLHDLLRTEGIVPLERAQRYGDDLLHALEYLEDLGVLHRDIKPDNLVIGAGPGGKGQGRLTLIDFSLEGAPLDDLALGTPAYRDPFLAHRGRWDLHADRWSAAVVLHEMLTGARPVCHDPTDLDAPLLVSAERFDPAVRTRMADFFARALAPCADRRFPDARSLRAAFARCFEPEAAAARGRRRPDAELAEPAAYTDDELAAIPPDTPLEALRLTIRARNALDRAGFLRLGDLLRLPDNRLSAMRGVGSAVSREILDFRDRWRALRQTPTEPDAPFFPGYQGDDLLLGVALAGQVPAALTTLLADAGLPSLAALAAAPEANLATLAARHGLDLAPLRAILEREHALATEREHPTTLEGWLAALFPPRRKSLEQVRLLYGLDPPFAGRLDVTVRQVAAHKGVTTAAVYITLGRARSFWRAHRAFPELLDLGRRLFEPFGGAVPLSRFAEAVLCAVPHSPQPAGSDPALHRARAAVLARVIEEAAGDGDGAAAAPFRLARLSSDGPPWLITDLPLLDPLRRLGAEADRLAAYPVLPSPGEVQRALAAEMTGISFAALPPARLVELAAEASRTAACSTRLELYPRSMPAARALELTAGVLTGALKPAEVRARVAARYPDAAPLPDIPALHALLKDLGYDWNDQAGHYERPGESQPTSLQTSYAHGTLASRGPARPGRAPGDDAVRRHEMDEALQVALERGGFRALYVTADRARRAALALGRAVGRRPILLDRELLAAMDEAAAGKVDRARIDEAEAQGPAGPAWPALCRLAAVAAERLLARWLPPSGPLVLVQPGLLARYGLREALGKLVQHTPVPGSPVLLLIPAHDVGGAPTINGSMLLPGMLMHQATWVPGAWVDAASPTLTT